MHLLGTPDLEADIKNRHQDHQKNHHQQKNVLKIQEKHERILNDSRLNISILSFWKSCYHAEVLAASNL